MRTLSAGFGILLVFLVIVLSVSGLNVSLDVLINPTGLALVILGSAAAIFLSYSITDIGRAFNVTRMIFFREETNPQREAKSLFELFQSSNFQSVSEASLQKLHPFVADCIAMLKDDYSDDEIRKILKNRIQSHWDLEIHDRNLLRSISKYPPAFGMIGTVLGLIALMAGLTGSSSEGAITQVGPNMAVALTTTLYGLAISNFFFKPIADNLAMRSERNAKVREMILESTILWRSNSGLLTLQDTLNSYLTPKEAVHVKEMSRYAA